MVEEHFESDKLEGLSKWYYENGVIKYIDTYKSGQRINRKSYDTVGKLEFEKDYAYIN